MLYNALNGRIVMDDTYMDYIRFGRGNRTLVMIPGVGDGLKTVRGMALPFAVMYRNLVRDYTVFVFSQRNRLPDGYTTRDMANDVYSAIETLNIAPASILGVSEGGMIAQHIAIDHPEAVKKLILAVTSARPNDTLKSVVNGWLGMAKRGDYRGIMLDTAEKSYSEKYLKKARVMYSLIANFGKPKDFSRFITMANACLTHNAYDGLASISCPTLVIGGRDDRIVTGEASEKIAEKIDASILFLYDVLGHGAYEEARDFIGRVRAFIEMPE